MSAQLLKESIDTGIALILTFGAYRDCEHRCTSASVSPCLLWGCISRSEASVVNSGSKASHSHPCCTKVLLSPHPPNTWCLPALELIWVRSGGYNKYTVETLCSLTVIALVSNVSACLLLGHLHFFLEKCLFQSSNHF